MRKEKGVYVLETTDYKILDTVYLLNQDSYYPLPEGVYKILTGSEDEDVVMFNHLPTYKTLISYGSKKISRYIIMLIRYKYLERVYDEKSDKLYLKVSTQGELALVKYHKKHKYSFKQKQVNLEPTIVKLNLK